MTKGGILFLHSYQFYFLLFHYLMKSFTFLLFYRFTILPLYHTLRFITKSR